MLEMTNRYIALKRRPTGIPTDDDFEMLETSIRDISDGEVLRRTVYISLDPYIRRLLSPEESGWSPLPLGRTIGGDTVSVVIASRNPEFAEGDYVAGGDGWQEYGLSDGGGLRKIDPELTPKSLAIGALGMHGRTAYGALLDIGQPKPGETVVVSAAAGAIGSLAGQIAKIKGCRTVGITGSDEKCRVVTEVLGFDACVNHRSESLSQALREACPDGIDVYYDNVAGTVLEAVLDNIRHGARIALVGLISQYNANGRPAGPNLVPLLANAAMIKGYQGVPSKTLESFDQDMGQWIREGRVKALEHVVTGLENAPRAFIGLFAGENIGKLLVYIPE